MESGDIAPCSMVKWSQYVHKHLLPAWGPTYIQRRQCVILSVCCCGIFLFSHRMSVDYVVGQCSPGLSLASGHADSHHIVKMSLSATHQATLHFTLQRTSSLSDGIKEKLPSFVLSSSLEASPAGGDCFLTTLKKKGMNKEISVDFHKKPDLHIEQTTSICSAHQWERFFFFRPQIQCAPKKISSRHYDTSDPICYENRWGCVFNWLLSTAHSIAAKQLNHNTTSVLEMKQRRFVLSVCQGGWTATGKYSARLTHCYCLYKHTHNCCRYENWLAWVGLL